MRGPNAAGVKVTVMVQVELSATGVTVEQDPPREKSDESAPVTIDENVTLLPLVLLSVMVLAGLLGTPTD